MTTRIPVKLRSAPARINPFFRLNCHPARTASVAGVAAVLFLLTGGCASSSSDKTKGKPDPNKEFSSLHLHMEQYDIALGVGKIEVFRASPVSLFVEKSPFLDEGDLAKARLIESPLGGHVIQLEYTHRGKMALQLATASHPGSRVAVWARWTEARWLGAPVVQRGIEDGTFTFTPDCTYAEADRIVRGLNNMAIKLENQEKPKKPKAGEKENAGASASSKKRPSAVEEEKFK